jgi:SURF4 family protein
MATLRSATAWVLAAVLIDRLPLGPRRNESSPHSDLASAVFTVVAGVLFHAYWADADAAARMGDFINFWKNLSIAGGFLMVFAFGPGRYSVDRG